MPVLVPPSGPLDAQIALVGEAPGEQEELRGQPFVGRSGHLLDYWLDEVGINKWSIYKDNVVQYRPPVNNIHAVPKEEIHRKWIPSLLGRLSKLHSVRAIVPTGNLACSALLGPSEGRRLPGVTSIRGGVYDISALRVGQAAGPTGGRVVCIPTIHPAWYLRGQMKKQGRALADWRRI